MKFEVYQGVFAGILTAISGWLGGWDSAVQTLAIFMVVDYVTGFLVGIRTKSLNSEVMFWGGIRKGAILAVIMIAVILDSFVGNESPIFRTLAIYFYVAREGLSVVENLGKLGVPMPSFIKDVLEQVRDKGGK